MATATVARTAQALRNRRDPPRLSISKRQATMDGSADAPAAKKRKLDEPHVRTSEYILRKHSGKPPSLVIHLQQTHFRFEGQDGSFAYESPMRFILQHLRNQTIPHEMLEELLANNVTFYDGCLIVEVHNHRTKDGKQKSGNDSAAGANGMAKFSMHNYNEHITPSPMAPYPSKARIDAAKPTVVKEEEQKGKDKSEEGPKITTVVLHPTPLTQHHEMLILARTQASEMKSKKSGGDGATPSSAQPPTPQLSVPPTPVLHSARTSSGQSQKMCLEEGDFYSFQADLLVATEAPLYLEPVSNFHESQKVIEMLQNPLHQEPVPSRRNRKRTTAEMAADDAQAAEIERRMLIMEERIKTSGTGLAGSDNQQAAATLGLSRFKTIEMVRQKHEEKERAKKEEEARAALEKKQQEELAQQTHQRAIAQQQHLAQRQIMLAAQQANQAQQAPSQQALLMAAQQQSRQRMAQQIHMTSHAHPQHANMLPNSQQAFQAQATNQANVQQNGQVARNVTPAINSSPPVAQNGFPMVATNSQGAGSPPRPPSASMARPNTMARQLSQQHPGSRNGTPQIPQGTPTMGPAVANRQMAQTPRMQPSSPAVGLQQSTPTSATMQMQTPQLNAQHLTHEQQMLLAQRVQMMQNQNGLQASSPQQNMAPGHFQQQLSNMQRQMMANRNAQQTPVQGQAQLNMQQQQAAMARSRQAAIFQRQQAFIAAQQQQQAQLQRSASQAGSPGAVMQQTPQMGHAHPQQQQLQQMQQDGQQAARQQAVQALRAQQLAQLKQLAQQYGNLANIPQQVLMNQPPQLQATVRHQVAQMQLKMQQQHISQQQQLMQQQQQQQQQQAGQMQTMNQGGQEQVPGSTPNPQFMQQLRSQQQQLAARAAHMAQAQQQHQQQLHQMQQQNGMPNGFNMNMAGMAQQQFNAQQLAAAAAAANGGNNSLNQHIAQMHNALNQQGGGPGNAGSGVMQ